MEVFTENEAATDLRDSRQRRLRIAWISDVGGGGGVPGMATQLVSALSAQDCDLVVFSRTPGQEIDRVFPQGVLRRTSFIVSTYQWEWGKWYSRDRRVAFLASFFKRISAGRSLVLKLLAEHARRPFDVVVQFSQIELFGLRRHAARLPIVIYPCVHADGERQACIREQWISRRCEPWWWRLFRGFYLELRSRIQARDLRLARKIIGMSNIFNQRLKTDYSLDNARFGVVYHPIQLDEISAMKRRPDAQIRLLFVGRISVRKGVELIIEAAPKLLAKHPDVTITIVGAGALWSNYEPLLGDCLQEPVTWKRSLPHHEVIREMENSDILLIPSHYEPGGIVVGEALAAGMLVVASDVVGSAEILSERACVKFSAGDASGFIGAVETAIERVRMSPEEVRRLTRKECEKHFSLSLIGDSLFAQLRALNNETA
jgi:glycosyltransferase involved in cell wall biosynthesis